MKLTPATIVILRLAVALFFLYLGYTKIQNGWLTSSEALKESLLGLEQSAPPSSKWYIEHVGEPALGLWSKLISLGETALGISLFLGLLVRLSTFIGMVAVLNFHFTSGAINCKRLNTKKDGSPQRTRFYFEGEGRMSTFCRGDESNQ
jgi:uncharacterized membrane protein YphA (DoxX/SURF4 family)